MNDIRIEPGLNSDRTSITQLELIQKTHRIRSKYHPSRKQGNANIIASYDVVRNQNGRRNTQKDFKIHPQLRKFAQVHRSNTPGQWISGSLTPRSKSKYNLAADKQIDCKKLLRSKIIAIKHALYFIHLIQNVKSNGIRRKYTEPQFEKKIIFIGSYRIKLPIPFNPEEDFICFFRNQAVLLMLALSSSFTPLSICFASQTQYDDWFSFDLVMDIFFSIDMTYTFLCAYHNQNQHLRWKLKEIANNYVTGWFFIDLLTVLPFELMIRGITEQINILRQIYFIYKNRALKTVKLIRVIKFVKLSSQTVQGDHKSFASCFKNFFFLPQAIRKVFQLIVLLLYLNHLATSVFILLVSFDRNPNDWVSYQ